MPDWKARNATIGEYKVLEARSMFNPTPATATWHVYRTPSHDPLSIHRTYRAALSAVRRYQAADARRKRA